MVLGKRCLPSLLPVGQKQHDVRRTPQRTVPFMKDVVLKRQEFIAHRETHTRTLLTKPTIPEAFPWEKCRVANHIYPAFKPDSSILLLHFCRHKNCKVTCFFVLSCYYPPWFLYFCRLTTSFVGELATVVASEHRIFPGARMSLHSTAIVKTPIGGWWEWMAEYSFHSQRGYSY